MRNIISKFFFTLLALSLGIGQMWGQTFRYYIAISNDDATSVSSGKLQVFKTSDDEHFENVTSQFTLNSNYSTSSAPSNLFYNSSYAFSNSSTDAILKGVRYTKNKTFTINWTKSILSFNKITFQGFGASSKDEDLTVKNSTSDAGETVTLAKGTTITPYEVTKNFTQENGITIVSANTDNAYAITILHAVDHAEITSTETEMVTSESLQMEGWPSGGTWSIAEGGTGTGSITSAGVLTASANGTIKVKYAKEGYGEDIKTITVSDTRSIYWFAAGATDAATAEVTHNSTFFTMGVALSSTSGQSGDVTLDKKYSLTKRLNTEKTQCTFTIPSGTTGTLYMAAISSGSANRTLTITKEGSATGETYGATTNTNSSWSALSKSGIAAGTYTITSDANARVGMLLMQLSAATPVETFDITLNPAGGTIDPVPSGWTYDNVNDKYIMADVEDGSSVALLALTKSGYLLDGWKDGENADYTSPVTIDGADLTLTAQWASAHTVSFVANGGGSSMESVKVKDGTTYTIPACGFTPEDANHTFSHWAISGVAGKTEGDPDETFTMPAGDVTLTAQWTASYTITEGTHTNGSITIDPTSAAEGETITLTATPNANYLFDAWDVYKTGDESTKVSVTSNQFTMPAYGVTVNATFVADTRKKVLYLTSNTAEATVSNDKLYAALKDDYNVTITAPASQTLTDYDLVVLHESIGGTSSAAAVTGCKTTSVPVLNTKSYFYNNANTSDRWGWGTPNAGQSVKGCTPNAAYCNIADHPIFADVIDAGFVEITDDAAAKCMQPIGAFTTGLEGYTLATTPNNGEGNGCAIHEIPAGNSVRGAGTGKYLMISVSNAKLNALNANGQKLFQNAAAYLIDGSTTWTPITVPTSPEVTATPSENYTEGNTITLTASATGTTASTTYTWYKGDNWAAASATTPVQAAATAASDGNVFTKTAALADAGTYWCNISNGTSCDVQASVTITVASASTPTHAISYDNVKGADMSAYPTEYTEGVGVASFDPLADITGWHFVEWSPASIANDATTDQTITAVWAQVFEVTFNLNGQSGSFDAQDIISGGKVTKPVDPIVIGQEFGGWYKEAGCANAWDFNTDVITEATVLYAKWTAFTGCTELWPATSGDAPTAEGDEINMQTGSTGATMTVLAKANKLAYTSAGLQFGSESGVKVNVVLNNEIVVGTRISMTLVAGGEKTRGLFLYDANGNKINAFTCWVDGTNAASNGAEETFTYTVVANDGLAGTNEFQLWRNNTVYLKSLKVSNCGDAIIYHNLTSEVNIAGKGTVTLGASSVREGLTTTAEYSAIDEAYEFVNWTVSGEGASIADATANPATITMGTGDAVVTLNLQLKPVYYTVTYKDGESSMGTEEVAENGHPTATGITTAKKGYNFLGWSETNGGAVVELSTITITAATNVYAKYAAIPCPTYGTVFSMSITDPEDTEYNENNEFGLEIGATYTGGKAYSGSKSSTKRIGKIDANGEYSFNANGDVTVKVDLDCSLQEGDVLSFTSTPSRELKIQKVAGTDLYTTSGKSFTIPAESPLIGEYVFYLMRGNSESTFKTFNVYRPAVLTGVTLNDAVVAIDGKVTPVMTLAPAPDAYISSQVWSIVGEGEGTIANINTSTGEVTGVAIGSVTVKVVLNGSIENTCTVTVIDSYTQVDVSETSEWNFAGGAAASSKLNFPSNNDEYLLANISGVNNTPEFNARALVVKGKYVSNSQLQAQTIRFNVATSGKLTIRYACTSDKGAGNDRELYINGVATGSTTSNGEVTYTQVVPGGEVTIKALYDKESVLTEDIMNYKYIKFDVNPDVSDADYIRTTTEGRYGTICLPYDGVMVGATIYEAAYRDLGVQKIFFDEVINGEMEAGKPYLFLPKEGATQLGVYYTSSAAPVAATHYNGFHGYYDLGHLTDGETAYPYNVAVGEYLVYNNQYVMVNGTNSYLAQFRAYIVMSEMPTQGVAPAPGRRRVGMGYTGTNTATGVEDVQGDNVQCTKVIIDGQLYIIRGEKMYNANGLLVK